MAVEKFGIGVGVDVRGLRPFIRATRVASRMAATRTREKLRAAGEIVAVDARARALQHSESIPPTIKTRVYSGTVSVEAGRGVPLAALYELGNKGKRPGSFNHPVFARGDRATWTWAPQPGYPFLRPAASANMVRVEAEMLKVADDLAQVVAGSGWEQEL